MSKLDALKPLESSAAIQAANLKREPELLALREKKAALEKEKQHIVDTILTEGRLNASIIETANRRVEKLDVEISAIADELERLTPAYSQADLYQAAVEFVAGLNKVSQLMQGEQDPDTLRLIIRTYIDRIEMREDGSFAVYPNSNIMSSSNEEVWHAIEDILELVNLTFSLAA